MPLPPAPTKRAALLAPEAYDAPARTSHKTTRKSEMPDADAPRSRHPQTQDFDPRPGGQTEAPAAGPGHTVEDHAIPTAAPVSASRPAAETPRASCMGLIRYS